METWKDIPGFEGLYQASSEGRIRRVDSTVYNPHNGYVRRKGHIMRSYTTSDGYQALMLSKEGKFTRARVHRLVALAFIPNEDGKPYINHKNGNRSDNRVENLEWCTPRENSRHAVDVLHRTLNKRSVPVVRSDGRIYPDMKSAAEELGLKTGANIIRAMGSTRKDGKPRLVKGFSFRRATSDELREAGIG